MIDLIRILVIVPLIVLILQMRSSDSFLLEQLHLRSLRHFLVYYHYRCYYYRSHQILLPEVSAHGYVLSFLDEFVHIHFLFLIVLVQTMKNHDRLSFLISSF